MDKNEDQTNCTKHLDLKRSDQHDLNRSAMQNMKTQTNKHAKIREKHKKKKTIDSMAEKLGLNGKYSIIIIRRRRLISRRNMPGDVTTVCHTN